MIITGIEVIRGDPGVAARANPGLAVEVAPPQKLELTYGDKLRITNSFEYKSGVDMDVTPVGSVGKYKPLVGYSPIIKAEAPLLKLTKSLDFAPMVASVDVPITADISPGEGYDIVAEIKGYEKSAHQEVDGVITITGIPPTFKLIEETIYPYAYVYDGKVEAFTFTFKSDPFTPTDWIKGRMASHVEDEVIKQGGRVLEMRVYVDTSPLLWTDWRIEVVGIPPKTTAGESLGIVWWVAMILVVLALIALIIVTYTFIIKPLTYTHKPISEEVKAAMSRDSLISLIGDFEAKLKRTPTPPEELQKKSDDELRTYCDELASAVAPAAGGLGLAIAAAGVLGLGALALGAYAMSQPRKPER